MTDKPYITCKELYEFLADYLDGALLPDQRHEFDRHLGVCPSCVAYLDGYRCTIAMSKEAFRPADEPATGKAPPELLKAIQAARTRSK